MRVSANLDLPVQTLPRSHHACPRKSDARSCRQPRGNIRHHRTSARDSLSVVKADRPASGKERILRRTHEQLCEPIAIVGMGCRFPGDVNSPGDLWKLLTDARSGICEVSRERWDIDAYLDEEDVARPGKMTTRWGGFLKDVDRFDASFFGISPREARQMDPQQRLTLEVVWEALEDAGIDPDRLRGTTASVFMGSMWSDYAQLAAAGAETIDSHTATGLDTSIISARISYFLDLRGASITVNTAGSSSAVWRGYLAPVASGQPRASASPAAEACDVCAIVSRAAS
jgi:hypothetical protein